MYNHIIYQYIWDKLVFSCFSVSLKKAEIFSKLNFLPFHKFSQEAQLLGEGRPLFPNLTKFNFPNFNFYFTRCHQTKRQSVVENVHVCLCSDNSANKLDLGHKYEEADEEREDCSWWSKDVSHCTSMKGRATCYYNDDIIMMLCDNKGSHHSCKKKCFFCEITL